MMINASRNVLKIHGFMQFSRCNSYIRVTKLAKLRYISNSFLRGVGDLLGFVPGAGKKHFTKLINECQSEINVLNIAIATKDFSDVELKTGASVKRRIIELNTQLSRLNTRLEEKKLGNLSSKFSNCSSAICWGITLMTASVEVIEEIYQYSTGLEIVKNYDFLLAELMCYGDELISDAAKKINKDMDNIKSKYLTDIETSLLEISCIGVETGVSWQLAVAGTASGLVADLAWLATSIVVGDSLSNKINNYFSVECANAVAAIANHAFSSGKYMVNSQGNVMIVVSGNLNEVSAAEDVMRFDCFSRCWVELKYIGYLNEDRLFFDGDFFLYKDDDTEDRAESNIDHLDAIMNLF